MSGVKKKTSWQKRGDGRKAAAKGGAGLLVPVTFMRNASPTPTSSSVDLAAHLRDEHTISKYETVQPAVQYNGGALSVDNIRRTPTIHAVPLDDIHSPPYAIEPDEVFVRQYANYIRGRTNAYYTRICEKDIFAGYYRDDAEAAPVIQSTPDEIVDARCAQIRSGRRPTILLRENHGIANAPRFFCCDSLTALAAYRRLGFSLVPAAIFSTQVPPGLTHSAFEVSIATNWGDTSPRVAGFRPCNVDSLFATRLDDLTFPDALAFLEQRVENVLQKLQSFHAEGYETLHYHDTLHSTLVRTRDYLSGARLLLNAGLHSQAVSLYRSLYELHLNFYVDWLAPENSWMELAYAVNADNLYLKRLVMKLSEGFSQGRPKQQADQLTKRALLLARWLGVVANKASFAPVGIGLHGVYYGYLSSVQHQDFREAASHANRFRSEHYQVIDEGRQNWLRQLVNITVTETLDLIESDIGTTAP
ncbi:MULTISPECIES: hypothetical protein [unclassified Burkholderia]|uniref:hypothetical protein n=2 Tax=Burkholderia TaxID=32008 RepID=UPI00141EE364|nr:MULTISPECIES: hypothetical protein [unclassified Burkholderia]NIF11191.1 hypothetical protein [Burkholderia sp. Ax-1735]NIG04888.1 hypothetical protein [Burkholderia sp. Tr-849]